MLSIQCLPNVERVFNVNRNHNHQMMMSYFLIHINHHNTFTININKDRIRTRPWIITSNSNTIRIQTMDPIME